MKLQAPIELRMQLGGNPAGAVLKVRVPDAVVKKEVSRFVTVTKHVSKPPTVVGALQTIPIDTKVWTESRNCCELPRCSVSPG